MFTGIITFQGLVSGKTPETLSVSSPALRETLSLGDSISVNGACLTASSLLPDGFTADIMPETWNKTMLGTSREGDEVNLELAMAASGRFDGHLVQGHVDGVGTVASVEDADNSRLVRISLPADLSRFLAPKGSIAVNGVSLTVISAEPTAFTVGIIPLTWDNTTFHTLRPGDTVNLETDVIAKYVANFLAAKP